MSLGRSSMLRRIGVSLALAGFVTVAAGGVARAAPAPDPPPQSNAIPEPDPAPVKTRTPSVHVTGSAPTVVSRPRVYVAPAPTYAPRRTTRTAAHTAVRRAAPSVRAARSAARASGSGRRAPTAVVAVPRRAPRDPQLEFRSAAGLVLSTPEAREGVAAAAAALLLLALASSSLVGVVFQTWRYVR